MSLQEDYLRSIAGAIREKDGTDQPIKASGFADRIRAIPSDQTRPGEAPDPDKVYRRTRPEDWLVMPEPQDNEIYLLVHIPDGASALLAFRANGSGGESYTVALGTSRDGTFVENSSTALAHGSKYEAELFAENYGDLTSDGMKQAMVKISGMTINSWEPGTHSSKPSPGAFCDWNIVEIACRLPDASAVSCGNASVYSALRGLRYFTWRGENQASDMSRMFQNCRSLIAVRELDTGKAVNMNRMFYYCYALEAVPAMDTGLVTDMGHLFEKCRALTAIPQLDTKSAADMGNMFYECSALTGIPRLDTGSVTDMNEMFFNCFSLASVPEMDTSLVTNMAGIFNGCCALTAVGKLSTASASDMTGAFNDCCALGSVIFDNTAEEGKADISLADCSMNRDVLAALLESLPPANERTLTLTGNPGCAGLSEADKETAQEKGWILAL